MTLAFHIAHLPNQKHPVALKDLLVDEEPKSRRRMDWQEIKAALMFALPTSPPDQAA